MIIEKPSKSCRYISCQIGEEYIDVWKYRFGVQNSEMHRVSTELGIGEYHMIRYVDNKDDDDNDDPQLKYEYISEDETEFDDIDGDILILSRSDLEKLDQQIKLLKKSESTEENKWFIAMLEAIRDFTFEYPQKNQFIFEGEF